jgi:hypothetical protein
MEETEEEENCDIGRHRQRNTYTPSCVRVYACVCARAHVRVCVYTHITYRRVGTSSAAGPVTSVVQFGHEKFRVGDRSCARDGRELM